METPDITVNLPAEYFDALSEIISIGLNRANIDPKVRKELQAWWDVERELIENEIEQST